MVNDINTLNGALMELGSLMAQNLTTQGLIGVSASDGLTTLANKILQISGDTPTTIVIFDEDGSVDHSSTLFGEHISLRNSGTGTVTYNNNGYYVLTNTKASAECFIEFPLLQGIYDKSFKVTARSQGTTTYRCPIALYYYLDDNNWGGVKDEIAYLWTSAKTNGVFTENSITTGNSDNVEVVNEFIFDVDENTLTVNDYVGGVLKGTKSMTVPVTLTSSVKWGTTTTWTSNTSRNLYEIKAEYTGVAPTPCSEYIAEIDNAIEYINGDGS